MIACAYEASLFWLAVALAAVGLVGAWVALGAAQKRERALQDENRKLSRSLRYAMAELELTREWHG